ncbi:Oidioi.mRNA.OKI2018_I69.PAR.g8887.t1.cds [Oikopleura dioica]|uniref:Oidioi.mRNA.OKI2018_I69.PAR.g8887.t1.cds n=1 Tax=Oikopleura dioica TaxID=34765 RepID=A0ABN7RP12_OIKDI|nr:Oidioi.mRNA.OKI2018_I69.PAR.g8887.t1.cds [Oikopleura dioica]
MKIVLTIFFFLSIVAADGWLSSNLKSLINKYSRRVNGLGPTMRTRDAPHNLFLTTKRSDPGSSFFLRNFMTFDYPRDQTSIVYK